MKDYIRKAVELADGWRVIGWGELQSVAIWDHTIDLSIDGDLPPYLEDALAAQLVRQVNATDKYSVAEYPNRTDIYRRRPQSWIKRTEGPDRTMNTIKAIVDSGVLS